MLKALYPLLRISLIIIIYVICSKHHVKEQNVRISLFHRHFAAPNRTVLASTHNTLIVCNLQLCSLLSQPGSFGVRRAEGRFTALLDIFPVSSSLLFLSPDNDGWERGMSKTQKHGCFFLHICVASLLSGSSTVWMTLTVSDPLLLWQSTLRSKRLVLRNRIWLSHSEVYNLQAWWEGSFEQSMLPC